MLLATQEPINFVHGGIINKRNVSLEKIQNLVQKDGDSNKLPLMLNLIHFKAKIYSARILILQERPYFHV